MGRNNVVLAEINFVALTGQKGRVERVREKDELFRYFDNQPGSIV